MIPATAEELSFVESHSELNYSQIIKAFQPFLGNRRVLKEVVGVTQQQMEDIIAIIK